MSDLEFVQRCVKGDKQAWDEFSCQYTRLIYSYILNVLNCRGYSFEEHESQDIFQEVFCALIKDDFRKLRSFQAKNGCSLASWLRQVTIRLTLNYLRRIKPFVSLDKEIGNDLTLKDILEDGSVSVVDAAVHKEMLTALEGCIDNLEDNDKYFLELHFHQGIRLEDLKGHFKLTRGAIDMRKVRLIERLKDCFKSKSFKLDL